MKKINRLITIFLVLVISALLSSCKYEGNGFNGLFNTQPSEWSASTGKAGGFIRVASQVESAADRLFSLSLSSIKQLNKHNAKEAHTCQSDDTAIITIYSTNSRAQPDIEVLIDGNFVGNLTTYFPDGGPVCKAHSTEGVITLLVPAGDHVLDATSPNFIWSNHTFSTEKCECTLLPLS